MLERWGREDGIIRRDEGVVEHVDRGVAFFVHLTLYPDGRLAVAISRKTGSCAMCKRCAAGGELHPCRNSDGEGSLTDEHRALRPTWRGRCFSVSAVVRMRRYVRRAHDIPGRWLEAARAQMLRAQRARSLARIAAGHGFTNPRRLAQRFRRTYGADPPEALRARSGT